MKETTIVFVKMSVMSIDEQLVCTECESLISCNRDVMSIVLDKYHYTCAMELVNLGIEVNLSHVDRTFAFDNAQLFQGMMNRCQLDNISLVHLWRRAIDENSVMIMTYLDSFNEPFDCDIRYAISVGNLQSVRFLITNLHRVPAYDDVEIAVECGACDILRFLRDFAETNNNFKQTMWDTSILKIAIQCGSINCVKLIVNEESTLWQPSIISDVCHHLSRKITPGDNWQGFIDPNHILNQGLIPRVIECVRFIHDSSLPFAFYTCPILFDNCQLLNCYSCVTTITSFINVRQILKDRFNGSYRDIVKLVISFSSIYQKCKTCGTLEVFDTDIHHINCSKCKTTYYCNQECQLKDWKAGHRNTCGKYSAAF